MVPENNRVDHCNDNAVVYHSMGRTVLIAGNDTPLKECLLSSSQSRGFNVVCGSERLTPFSARSLVLKGLNEYGSIDSVLLVHSTDDDKRLVHDIPAVDLETAVDSLFKSPLFILKEVLTLFLKQKEGTISFVLQSSEPESSAPLNAFSTGGFKALAGSLFSAYQNETFVLNGFDSHEEHLEEYAGFILDTLEDKNRLIHGKWHRFSDRSGFFRSLNLPGLGR